MKRTRIVEKHRLQMHAALVKRPHSYAELATLTGLAHETVERYVLRLRDLKSVHIADWGPSKIGSLIVPCFAWGNKPDKVRPAAMTAAQRMAKTRASRRAA